VKSVTWARTTHEPFAELGALLPHPLGVEALPGRKAEELALVLEVVDEAKRAATLH
jgi:hypothetical protein